MAEIVAHTASLPARSLGLVRLLHAADTIPRGGVFSGYYALQASLRYVYIWLHMLTTDPDCKKRNWYPPLDVAVAWCVSQVGMGVETNPHSLFCMPFVARQPRSHDIHSMASLKRLQYWQESSFTCMGGCTLVSRCSTRFQLPSHFQARVAVRSRACALCSGAIAWSRNHISKQVLVEEEASGLCVV